MSEERNCEWLHKEIRRRFPAPGFVVMEEVRNATGFDSNRSADAMALGLYKTRGRELWGFEMKVSRTDWLKELDQPEKSESWLRFCDRWALVVTDASIVHTGELPEAWGLYAPVGKRLKCITPAPKLDPDPLTRIALTALMYAGMKVQDDKLKERLKAEYERGRKSVQSSIVGWENEAEKLREVMEEFERVSGINLRYYDVEKVKGLGTKLNALTTGWNLQHRITSLSRAVETMEDLLPELRQKAEILKNHADGLAEMAAEPGI